MNTEQSGTYVMVSPQIDNDPKNRQGMIGMVVDADLEKDDIYVSFGKDKIGLYSTNALMVLQHKDEIWSNATANHREIGPADFKKLLEISMLMESKQPGKLFAALEMARFSENTMKYGMTTLQDRLGLELSYEPEISASKRR